MMKTVLMVQLCVVMVATGCRKNSKSVQYDGPSLFQGKQAWEFSVSFESGDPLDGNGGSEDGLTDGYERLPLVGNYLSCAVSTDSESGSKEVNSGNEIWLEGDGETVGMQTFSLWNRGDESASFKLHYTDGQTIVSGDFTGSFGADGGVEGTVKGRFILLELGAGPGGGIAYSRVGAWTIANGHFTLRRVVEADTPTP